MNTTQNTATQSVKDNKRRWSKEEDDALVKAVGLYGNKKWKEIAACVPGRTNV